MAVPSWLRLPDLRCWRPAHKIAGGKAAMDAEDLEPRNKRPKLRDLDTMGVGELEDYIGELKAEIERVEAKLRAKRAHLAGVAGLFKT
jgi:uncharacterized small protein (DUF1192 family)